MLPDVAFISLINIRNVVVFPAPFAPKESFKTYSYIRRQILIEYSIPNRPKHARF